MISFIIIGRNEGWKLTKCFESIFDTIRHNKLREYEIIYVDSQSTDDSIERAKTFDTIKIFQITGTYNAAIARNIGAKESKGDVLFFIDGDMELIPDFLPYVYTENEGLLYDFVSGNWINYRYNDSWSLISKSLGRKNARDLNEFTTGGLFFINRNLWLSIGGMKAKLSRSQDLDLGIRLAKKSIFLVRKKELLAIHHTIPHNDIKRMWKLLFSGARFYRIVLLRDNFLNKYQWVLFLKGNYTFFILGLIVYLILQFDNLYLIFIYLALLIVRSIFRQEKSIRLILSNIIFFSLYEVLMFFAFFLFWPKNHKMNYIKLKK